MVVAVEERRWVPEQIRLEVGVLVVVAAGDVDARQGVGDECRLAVDGCRSRLVWRETSGVVEKSCVRSRSSAKL